MTKKYVVINKSNIIKIFLLYFTVLLFFIDEKSMSYEMICILTLVDVAICELLLYYSEKLNIRDAVFWFLSITILFSLGQNIAYPFLRDKSLVKDVLLYPYKYSETDMNLSSIYTLQAFNCLVLGLMSKSYHFSLRRKEIKIFAQTIDGYYIAKSAYYIGTAIVAIAFVPQIQYTYLNIYQFIISGYGETITSQMSGLFLRLHYLFFPGLIMRLCAKFAINKNTLVDMVIFLGQAIIFLAIGDRGTGLTLFVIFIWIRSIFDKKFNLKKYVLPCALVVILVPIIKYYRIYYTEGTKGALSGAIDYIITNNPILDLLLETGGTQRILIMTIDKVKSEGLAMGKAYLDFFIKMLPSRLGVQQNYGTLANWVINSSGYQTYGFSIWAEAYLNFGYIGIPFMYIMGIILKHLLEVKNRQDILSIIRTAITLYFFADVARRSFSEFGYNFLYNLIIPVIGIYVLASFLRRRHEILEAKYKTKD